MNINRITHTCRTFEVDPNCPACRSTHPLDITTCGICLNPCIRPKSIEIDPLCETCIRRMKTREYHRDGYEGKGLIIDRIENDIHNRLD